MLWQLVTSGILGVLLGLWLRVPAILAAAVPLVVITALLMTPRHWSLLEAVGFMFMLVTVLQIGYLIGLLMSLAWTRAPSRHSTQISTCQR